MQVSPGLGYNYSSLAQKYCNPAFLVSDLRCSFPIDHPEFYLWLNYNQITKPLESAGSVSRLVVSGWLFATLWAAALQAPLSIEISRQE